MRWLLATAALAAGAARAEDAATAPDILVQGTPLAAAGAGEALNATDLTERHAVDLTDALKRLGGGVYVNEVQGNPLQPDIGYRGYTASPLLGTPQGLSVYVDGVRVNQPFGDVVSWDLIPTSAIRTITLVEGADPLFGRNSLGGALAVTTKDGRSDPGMSVDLSYGSFRRKIARATIGGSAASGLHWFGSADYFDEAGWRNFSPSTAGQLFGKLGWGDAKTDLALSVSHADTDLNGNGLQEQRLLAGDRRSVYSYPDNTSNRTWLANFTGRHAFSDALTLTGNGFWRRIRSATFNGDVNDDSLGESLYQPNVAERAALAAAGYTGVPVAGETQANTPFPRFRCIANVLLNIEPNEKCDGLANRSATRQREWGGTAELAWQTGGLAGNRLTVGMAYVNGRSRFVQSSQFGYLAPDRGIVAVAGRGAFADGSQDSENAFDARVDLTGRTAVLSAYALDAADLTRTLHLDLSARFDRTVVRNRDAITPGGGGVSLSGNHRYDRLNPAAALRWSATPAIAFDVSVGRTSRAPSAVELGCSDPDNPCRLPNALAGDPPLEDVIATTWQAGVTAKVAGVRLRAATFRTVAQRDILFVTDDSAGFGYFRNVGTTRRQGFEADAEGRLGPVRLSAHYTFLDPTFRTGYLVDGSGNSSNDGPAPGFEGAIAVRRGDRLPLVPRHLGKVSLAWDPVRQLSLTADLLAASGVYARGNENNAHQPDGIYYLGRGRTAGYAVVNAGLEVRPAEGLALYLQCDNLLGERYATAAQLAATAFDAQGNFVARPFAGPVIGGERPLLSSTFSAPGSPRAVRVGARLRFR